MTVQEVAALLRVSTWTVGAMTRDGRLPRMPGIRRTRIPRSAVEALMEPSGQAPDVTPVPRRRIQRRPPLRALAGGAPANISLHRSIGPAPGDVVVVRCVSRQGR